MDFRKRGPAAFKPKLPAARARAAPATAPSSVRATNSPDPVDAQKAAAASTSTATTSATPAATSSTAAPATPTIVEPPTPAAAPDADDQAEKQAASTAAQAARPSVEAHKQGQDAASARSGRVTRSHPEPTASKDITAAGSSTSAATTVDALTAIPTPVTRAASPSSRSQISTLEPLRMRELDPRLTPESSASVQPEISAAGEDESAPPASAEPSAAAPSSTATQFGVAPPTASTKKRGRKNKATGDVDETAEEGDGATQQPKKRARAKKAQDGSAAPKPRKRKAATMAVQPSADGERAEDGAVDAEGRASKASSRARSLTPADAEDQTVDHQKLRMSDLTRDLHIGKKFSRHDELKERERERRRKRAIAQAAETMGSGEGGDAAAGGRSPAASAVGESSLPPQQLQQQQQQQQGGAGRGLSGAGTQQLAEQGLETPATASGPQFHIVDGQIVVDQSSLLVDRHAAAAAAHAGQDMEEIEENDFTRLTTSASYMTGSKLRGPNHWSDADTERFYEYLAMFGTDFETISMMFPGKSRRAIKMKFNREEKVRPRRITAAVVGKKHVAIDLEHFRRRAGGELESLESIKSELADHESTWNAKFEDARRAHEEEMQRKKDELFAEEEEGGGGGEGAAAAAGDGENGRQGKGRKKGGGAGYRGRGRKGIQT